MLNIGVLKRGLKSKYRFVETREATAMYDKYEVMEVTLSGHWYEIVKGQPKESYGDRSFQGIGKTTREAKQAAAKAALTKLRATMPGIKFKPGVIPFEWSDWCRKNLKRGALLEDLLKTLTTKGFHPAKNPGFMEKFLLIRADSASMLNLNSTPSTWPRESRSAQGPGPTPSANLFLPKKR